MHFNNNNINLNNVMNFKFLYLEMSQIIQRRMNIYTEVLAIKLENSPYKASQELNLSRITNIS